MKNSPDQDLARAADILRRGGVVAFPTETSYGLAVDPFNPAAVDKLFAVKARPRQKPVLTLIDHPRSLPRLAAATPPCFQNLMARFWPGPLTLIFPARPGLPAGLTAGTGTIGIRLSSHPMAAALARAFGGPITATSANPSGAPPATTAAELGALGLAVDMIIDGGPCPGGPPSTIVAPGTGGGLFLIRQGRTPFADILAAARGPR